MSPRPAYLAALLPGPPSGERLRPPRGAFPGHDVPRPPAGQLAGAAEGLAREDAALRAYELGPEPPPSDQRARHDELAAGAEAWPATSFREQMHTLRNQALAPARPRPTDAFPAAAGSEHRDGVSRSPAAAGSPPSGHAGRRDALRPPRPPGTGESGAGTLPLAPPGSPSTAVEAGRGLDSLAGTHRRGGGAPGAQQATASPSGAATALAGPAQLRAARRDHADATARGADPVTSALPPAHEDLPGETPAAERRRARRPGEARAAAGYEVSLSPPLASGEASGGGGGGAAARSGRSAGAAAVTIGTIEVTVLPSPPPAPPSPAWPAALVSSPPATWRRPAPLLAGGPEVARVRAGMARWHGIAQG